MERGFYHLDREGSAERALPFIFCRIARRGEQARASANHLMEVSATTGITAVHLRRVDGDHNQTRNQTKALQEKVTHLEPRLESFGCQAA